MKWGVLWNWNAMWVGKHYSPHNRRHCINLIPFFTIWVCEEGGHAPHQDMPAEYQSN